MSMNDMAYQGKPQSAPLRVVNQRVAHAIELLENLKLLARRNAHPVVDHFQFDRAVVSVELHAQILLNLRVLQRVVYKVQERTGNRLAIQAQGRKVVGDVFLEGEAVLFDLVSVGIERV